MNTAVIKVEVKRRRLAFAEGERCSRLTRVGETMQLSEMQRAVALFDVAEDTACADRAELLIITDQSDTPAPSDGELDGGVE